MKAGSAHTMHSLCELLVMVAHRVICDPGRQTVWAAIKFRSDSGNEVESLTERRR